MTDSQPRDKPLNVYVTQETKDLIRQEATDRDLSISAYVNKVLQQARVDENQTALAAESDAEQRLAELIALAKDELEDVAEHTRKLQRQQTTMQAVTGAYAIALFHLLKEDYTEHEINHAFTLGSNRVRKELDEQLELINEDTRANDGDADGDAEHAPESTDDGDGDENDRANKFDDIFDS